MSYLKWMFSRWHYWIIVFIIFLLNKKNNQISLSSLGSLFWTFISYMFFVGIFYLIIWKISQSQKKKH